MGKPIKLHSHITIEASPDDAKAAAKMVKGKSTIITLENGDLLGQDVMITNYYAIGEKYYNDVSDVIRALEHKVTALATVTPHPILRYKLELDNPTKEQAKDSDYIEVHIKVVLPPKLNEKLQEYAYSKNWHPSNNPFQYRQDGTIVQFVNKRFPVDADYDGETTAMKEWIDKQLGMFSIEKKIEAVIMDSNSKHDEWWLKA